MAEINSGNELKKKVSDKQKTEVSHSEAVTAFNNGKTVIIELYDEKGKWYAGCAYNLEYRHNLEDISFEPEEWSRAKFFVKEEQQK